MLSEKFLSTPIRYYFSVGLNTVIHFFLSMDKFIDRICGVRDRVINERFPELSPLEIKIEAEVDSDELMGYGELTWSGYYIDVDTDMKKATDDELYGGLAHELAHITIDERKNFVSRLITDIIYGLGMKYKKKDKKLNPINRWLNRNVYERCYGYVTQDERNTDLLVVERGAGDKLLAFLKFHDKHHKKYKPDEGLTVKELQQILLY